jgi:hypothetical protein
MSLVANRIGSFTGEWDVRYEFATTDGCVPDHICIICVKSMASLTASLEGIRHAWLAGLAIAPRCELGDHFEVDDECPTARIVLMVRMGIESSVARDELPKLLLKLLAGNG